MREIHNLNEIKDGEIIKIIPASAEGRGRGECDIILAMSMKEYREQYSDPVANTLYSTPPISIQLQSTTPMRKEVYKELMQGVYGKDAYMMQRAINFIGAGYTKVSESELLLIDDEGFLSFVIVIDKVFLMFFDIPKGYTDKGTPKFTKKQRERIITWLVNHKDTEVTVTLNGVEKKQRIYKFTMAKIGNKTQTLFTINTNVLSLDHINYLVIDTTDLDYITKEWKSIKRANKDLFDRYRLSSFSDIPLRLVQMIPQIYSRNCISEHTDSRGRVTEWASQTITTDTLDDYLGNLYQRITEHLESNHLSTDPDTIEAIHTFLLDRSFEIAYKLKYLQNPITDKSFTKEGNIRISINIGKVDRQHIAKLLKDDRNI